MKSLLRQVPSLRFPREEETRFDQEALPSRLRHFIISGWISLVVYNVFLIADWWVGPQTFLVGLKIRLMLSTPLGLATLVFLTLRRRQLEHWPPTTVERIILGSAIVAALSVALVASSGPLRGHPWSVIYHTGFASVLIYGIVVQRMRFRTACILAACVLGIHWTCLAVAPAVPGEPILPVMLLIATVSFYTLLLSLRLELEERQRFRQQERAKALRAQLALGREQMERASRTDPLTAVANRRGLERYMDEAWGKAIASNGPFSLILIDVDHFKAYNDGYGHPAGDACLRHVARALETAMAATPGVVSRWGGEEFVVALPGTSLNEASVVARRLLDEVNASAIRHEYSATARHVTVSAGIGSRLPAQGSSASWQDLLAQADVALYQAKQLGRNRLAAFENSHASALS